MRNHSLDHACLGIINLDDMAGVPEPVTLLVDPGISPQLAISSDFRGRPVLAVSCPPRIYSERLLSEPLPTKPPRLGKRRFTP